MQSPLRSASPDGPGATFTWIVAAVVAVALLLSQTIFIVPAGNVAVVTTLGKVTGTPPQSRGQCQSTVGAEHLPL